MPPIFFKPAKHEILIRIKGGSMVNFNAFNFIKIHFQIDWSL